VRDGGYLLFSDVVNNAIYRWKEGEGERVFLQPSGFARHGDRSIARLEADGHETVLVEHYRARRINSPNDLVFRSNGELYFTDPPFGLPMSYDDPAKEVPFQGVYRLNRDGRLTLLTTALRAPNGIAFSPDERTSMSPTPIRHAWCGWPSRSSPRAPSDGGGSSTTARRPSRVDPELPTA
jgi:gluconolactonase